MFVLQFNRREKRFFKTARDAARHSDFRVKVGCCVVYKGKVISTGYSTEKTSPTQARYNRFRHFDNKENILDKTHSEIAALKKIRIADVDHEKLEVYVWREHADGTMAMSRPCPGCMRYIKSLGIRHINYTGFGTLIHEEICGGK